MGNAIDLPGETTGVTRSDGKTTAPSDLLARARKGDADAFWSLVEPLQRLVYSVAWGVLRDQDRAEDATQETMMRAWTTLDSLQTPGKLSGWLYTMARNVAYENIRQSEKQNKLARTAPEEHRPAVPEQMAQEEQFQLLELALGQLPEQHRTVIAMKYMQDASCQEIADALGIGIEAAKSRLFEARRVLRQKMESLERRPWKKQLSTTEEER